MSKEFYMKRQFLLVLVLGLTVAAGSVMAAQQEANLLVANLTDGEITVVAFRSSSGSAEGFELNLSPGTVSGVLLPRDMIIDNAGIFDIEIRIDGNSFQTLRGVPVDFSRGTPTLLMSTSEVIEENIVFEIVGDVVQIAGTGALLSTTKSFIPPSILAKLGLAAKFMAVPKIGLVAGGCMLVYAGARLAFHHFSSPAPDELNIYVMYN
jgi:hypothetical protein